MHFQFQSLAKTFSDGTQALTPTSFNVDKGNIVSLLGPSGCGKTTLLRLIAGLEKPNEGGRIIFGDRDVTHTPVEARKIGMVFQSYALFPNMNVRNNIGYGLKMMGIASKDAQARVDEVIALCQLEKYANRPVTALSGGQKQRVALARAVAPRPELLLLDEPLSALDATLRERLREELAMLLRQFEITAIFVTHDQIEALAIADQIAVMNSGQIIQMGNANDLYQRPANQFVAEFIGNAMPLIGQLQGNTLSLKGGDLPVSSQGDLSAYIRADKIFLDDNGPLQGEVSFVTFLGSYYKVVVDGVCDQNLTLHHYGDVAPKVGKKVKINIEPSSIIWV